MSVDDGQVIERVPLFSFLSIPEDLKSKFKVPKGCVITKEYVCVLCQVTLVTYGRSIALRKVKTLGFRKSLKIIRPGDYLPPLPQVSAAGTLVAEVEVEEGGSGEELPPFEPLVLWVHHENLSQKIEVRFNMY